MKRLLSAALRAGVVAALVAVAACSTPSKPTPAPLEPIATPRLAERRVWSAKLDSVTFPLFVAVEGDAFTVAGSNGVVLALAVGGGVLMATLAFAAQRWFEYQAG